MTAFLRNRASSCRIHEIVYLAWYLEPCRSLLNVFTNFDMHLTKYTTEFSSSKAVWKQPEYWTSYVL